MKTNTIKIIVASFFLVIPVLVIAAPGEENKNSRKETFQSRLEAQKEQWQTKLKERQEKKEERIAQKEEKKAERLALACENITQKLGERQTRFAEQKEALRVKKTERVEDRQADRAGRDQELSEKRKTAEERRAKMYQNLLNTAESDEQKAAVLTFQKAVEAAVAARQQAVDEALRTFRSSADALRAKQKDTRVDALAAFQVAASAALDKAKEDCANGVSSDVVRETYKKSLEEARATLKSTRKDEPLGQGIKALAETKNTSIRQAMVEYRNALEQALQALKAILGSQDDDSPEGSSEPNSLGNTQ